MPSLAGKVSNVQDDSGRAAALEPGASMGEIQGQQDAPQSHRPSHNPLPIVNLPKGGGAIQSIGEKFNVNAATGTASLTVPVKLTPSRGGSQPSIGLSYSSGNGNGPFGLGWSVSMSSISRKTDKGIPRYFDGSGDEPDSDVFIFEGEDLVPLWKRAGDGLVILNSEKKPSVQDEQRNGYRIRSYGHRIEGTFEKTERWINLADPNDIHWRQISRDNITSIFGRDANSRIYHQAGRASSKRIFTWLLSETYTTDGDAVRFDYKAEDEQGIPIGNASEQNRPAEARTAARYLKTIRYGNRVPNRDEQSWLPFSPSLLPDDQWMFSMVFDYGEHDPLTPSTSAVNTWSCRQDPFSSYRSGFEIRTYRLCKRMLMFHHFPSELGRGDYLVRSTELSYAENTVASYLTEVKSWGHVWKESQSRYISSEMPPLEFSYSQFPSPETLMDSKALSLDSDELQNIPAGIDGQSYQFIDLYGEGSQGILIDERVDWFYKSNLSANNFDEESGTTGQVAKFGDTLIVNPRPIDDLAKGETIFMDLSGNGQMDLIVLNPGTAGFYQLNEEDNGWSNYRTFNTFPNVVLKDANTKVIDLTGDGLGDILVTEDDVFTFYPSLGEDGYGESESVPKTLDELTGPRLIFADPEQSIYLADMSGDGLTDIVRIRNGDIVYWPNLGYGRFGARVTMDNAPWFCAQEVFNTSLVLLADIDGTGAHDIIFLSHGGVDIYSNESGNGFASRVRLSCLPQYDSLSHVAATDLLGRGTACLVWSTSSPVPAARMSYVDLMGGTKPHLLTGVRNNLGAETRLEYASSNKFYLNDKQNGHPWVTRLTFPVHCVEKVQTFDHLGQCRFESRYAYHHGFFDGYEREFRGFGMVEQWDSEDFSKTTEDLTFGDDAVNVDSKWRVAPVLTRTWYHTGAFVRNDTISRAYAHEYYGAPTMGGNFDAFWAGLLPDSLLPPGLSAPETREACRTLKGHELRKEVYSLDKSDLESIPYTITESNYALNPVQRQLDNHDHSIFSVHPRESITYHLERNPEDPRVQHDMTLQIDKYGNPLKTLKISYGRLQGRSELLAPDQKVQETTYLLYAEYDLTSAIVDPDDFLLPQPSESRSYQLYGFSLATGQQKFEFENFAENDCSLLTNLLEVPYEVQDGIQGKRKRLIDRSREIYRSNDLSRLLPLGKVESHVRGGQTFRLAFTPGLLSNVYRRQQSDGSWENLISNPTETMSGSLDHQAFYKDLDNDGHWWVPSGRTYFDPDPNATPQEELQLARSNFFSARRYTDPAGSSNSVDLDGYDLLPIRTLDAVGNESHIQNDYRVSSPFMITDANGNRSQCAFDEFANVVGTASMGKTSETLGDTLEGFRATITREEIDQFFENPKGDLGASLLASATSRMIYHPCRYWLSNKADGKRPSFTATITRENHSSSPVAGPLKTQVSFSYSDGFNREIQKKGQAEPDPTLSSGTGAPIRWVGSGWKVFNNKGKTVKSFEPFFDTTHDFKFDNKVGVSSTLLYDPISRVVATINPNHTWGKVVFTPWKQITFDANDTVGISDPATDPDIGTILQLLPQAEYLPTWYDARKNGQKGPEERDAAIKALAHADTPSEAHLDSLGRTFLSNQNNGISGTYRTRTEQDIEGNVVSISDAQDRLVQRNQVDMLGGQTHISSMEAGERWVLSNGMGKELFRWDSRGQKTRKAYDKLHRPVFTYLTESSSAEIMVEKFVYGESFPDPASHNQRGNLVHLFDQAGMVVNAEFDFKGNTVEIRRQLAKDYKTTLDWSTDVALEDHVYASKTTYDAMNRQTEARGPDLSTTRYEYNEASFLNRLTVNVRETKADGQLVWQPIVNRISYDAKGQRTEVQYGNQTTTTFRYDAETFSIINVLTKRGAESLQNLSYYYDAMRNVTRMKDDAQQTIYFRNQRVDPMTDYTYDACYRLIKASGREHLGQATGAPSGPILPSPDNSGQVRLDQPGDGNAMGRYFETYTYDSTDNLLSMKHEGTDPSHPGWTRQYEYKSPSQLEPGRYNNRLTSTTIGSRTETYEYKGTAGIHGNMTRMPHLNTMTWNFQDRLQSTSQQVMNNGGTPETAFYVYNTDGQRIRKVTERQAAAGQTPVKLKERIYLGQFEVYREYDGTGNISLEKETLSVADGERRMALIETRTLGDNPRNLPIQLIRFQASNHVESVVLELDDQAQVISYEEYTPFGTTSYQGVRNDIDSPKRYRFMGKERDEENGLYYRGARYYASWLGRWINADPIGVKDGLNLFSFVRGNPISHSDPTGKETDDKTPKAPPAKTAVELNQAATEYANKNADAYLKDHPEINNANNPGARGNAYHALVDQYIANAKQGADPESVEARTYHNVAVQQIPGTQTGTVLSVDGKGIVSDRTNPVDNLDTATVAPGKGPLVPGQVISFGELEHDSDHKSGGGTVQADHARWAQTGGSYKGGTAPRLVKFVNGAKQRLVNVGTAVKSTVTGGNGKGGSSPPKPPSGGGGGGVGGGTGGGGNVFKMVPGAAGEGVARAISPFGLLDEAVDLSYNMSGYLRDTGRGGADALQSAGNYGKIVLVAGSLGGGAGVVSEKAAEKLGAPNPEGVGQIVSVGVGAAVGIGLVGEFAEGGAALGSLAGPAGTLIGGGVGALAGLAAFYLMR